MIKRKKIGLLIIISSPSGAGKTTIAKILASKNISTELSISLTTRQPRPEETNGKDYKFVNLDYFKKKIRKESFLEYAKVFENFYGTLKSPIFNKLKKGKNIILDIDWQGARQIKKKLPDNSLSIFILPPSLKELKKRLKKRNHTNSFVINRMKKAKKEIMHWQEYDYVVLNSDLKKCIQTIQRIIFAENYRSTRQSIKSF